MSDYRWRFVGAVAIITIAAVSLVGVLIISMHDVRTVTHTVQADPGPPNATIQGSQLNQQLSGLTCDVWQTSSKVTFVCHQ